MDGVVKGLDKAMQSMDLEKVNYTFIKTNCSMGSATLVPYEDKCWLCHTTFLPYDCVTSPKSICVRDKNRTS